MEPKLVVIVGETASGKSHLGLELAKKFDGEIICADSRTVYKGMDIGTAKPTEAEQRAIRHHLLDLVEPNEKYNAAWFKKDATAAIKDVSSRGKLPIMVGGTGLYVDSVIFDYDFNNKTMSKLRPNTLVIGIKLDRAELNARIEKRVKGMVKEGIVDEVKQLAEKYGWDSESMTGIGYREFKDYINGKASLEESIAQTIKDTKDFAKRQRTWFRRPVYDNKSIQWVNNSGDAVDIVTTFLDKL